MLLLYQDLRRILVLTENLLYLAGKSLQRRAIRNGVLITIALSSGFVKSNYLSAQTLTPDQLTALIIGAFASYPAGTLLVRISAFLNRDNIDAAAGGYLHLTSHYKQSRMRLHLHYLWHEVFANDPLPVGKPLGYDDLEYSVSNHGAGHSTHDPETPPELVRDTHDFDLFREGAVTEAAQWRAHDLFINAGIKALGSPLPMGLQSARIGIHLGPVEDWYEKGFFSYEDFPYKAFSRDLLIKRIHRLVESKRRLRIKRLLAGEVAPSFWYAFTVRKFTSILGKSITALNIEGERHGLPDYFDAQHFIWPSPLLDAEVQRRFAPLGVGLERRLIEARKRLVREVFSSDAAIARRHLMRMFARDYARIFNLRLRFDGAWAAGRLSGDPLTELDSVLRSFAQMPVARPRVEACVAEARSRLDRLDNRLASASDHKIDATLHQVMQVAAHIDYREFHSRHLQSADLDALIKTLAASDEFTRDIGLLRELLQRIRVYHGLIKIQILDYWSIIHRIGDLH